MKILRSLTILAALAGTAYADAPAPKTGPTADKAPAKPAPPPEAKKAEVDAKDVEKFLAFFNKFVDAVVAAKEDCGKMTGSVNTLIDANQDMIKKIQEAKAANKDLPQAAKDKMMSRVKEMMPGMQKCGGDPNFQAAMKRMEGGKTAAKAPAPTKKSAK